MYDYNKAKRILDDICELSKQTSDKQKEYYSLVSMLEPLIIHKITTIRDVLLTKKEKIKQIFGLVDSTKNIITNTHSIVTSYYDKYNIEMDGDSYEGEDSLHNLDKATIESFINNYSEYMMYFYYSALVYYADDLCCVSNTPKNILNNVRYSDEITISKLDCFKSTLYFHNDDDNVLARYFSIRSNSAKCSERLMIVPKHIMVETDFEQEVNNFILFLEKTILEINLSKV
jgi:hypothetical protein